MRRLRVAMAQINSVVGDVSGNLARVLAVIERCRSEEAGLVVLPEMVLPGYPPEDLLFREQFLLDLADAEAAVVAASAGMVVVFGNAVSARGLYNMAVIAADGRLVTRIAKRHLPNYGVFDEARYFTPGTGTRLITWSGWRLGVSVCEDLWLPDGPYLAQARQGADLLINISASPYYRGKGEYRERMLATRADDAAAYLVWTNLVGAQDELVFDGQSAVFGPDGTVLARGAAFAEDVVTVDLARSAGDHRKWLDPRWRQGPVQEPVEDVAVGEIAGLARPREPVGARLAPVLPPMEELYRALVLGVRDYVQKNRFGDVVIGLSGGIDSALTACIAADALGPAAVHGVFMPSSITSVSSRQDAAQLAENLGIDWLEVSIDPMRAAFLRELAPMFGTRGEDLTEENLQARVRGVILMALSNKLGWLVLTTGNKSEMATGYSTLYGDMAGGFAVLKDVLKTEVFRLAHWVNRNRVRIPPNVLVKPPSAELREGQKDEDSLPPYPVLDRILVDYIERDRTPEDIVADGIDRAYVELTVKLVNQNEYKRRQAPVGIKVTARAFGRDRRMPITGRH